MAWISGTPYPFTVTWHGAVDNLTRIIVGAFPFDATIDSLLWSVDDANETYDTTTITVEKYDGTTHTTLETITTGAATGTHLYGLVANADLTSSAVAQGEYVELTFSNASTNADGGCTIVFYLSPKGLR